MKLSIISHSAFALALSFTLLHCGGKVTDPGSNTNWLKPCDASAVCGSELACICGHCTLECKTDDACSSVRGQAVCAVPSNGKCTEAIAICQPATNEGTSSSGPVSDMTLSPSAPATSAAMQPTLPPVAGAACSQTACSDSYGCQEVNGPRCDCPQALPAACPEGSLQTLPTPAGLPFCQARRIAADGSEVIGVCSSSLQNLDSDSEVSVVRWPVNGTAADIESVSSIKNKPGYTVLSVSEDGRSVLWGPTDSEAGAIVYFTNPARDQDLLIDDSTLGITGFSNVLAQLSRDGKVIVGDFVRPEPRGLVSNRIGFRLEVESGAVTLLDPRDPFDSDAGEPKPNSPDGSNLSLSVYAVDAKGDVLGGMLGNLPFLWTKELGIRTLALPTDLYWGSVDLLSPDGKVAVGVSGTVDADAEETVLWINGEVRAVSAPYSGWRSVAALDTSNLSVVGSSPGEESGPWGWLWSPGKTHDPLKDVIQLGSYWDVATGADFTAEGHLLAGSLLRGSENPTASAAFRVRLPAP